VMGYKIISTKNLDNNETANHGMQFYFFNEIQLDWVQKMKLGKQADLIKWCDENMDQRIDILSRGLDGDFRTKSLNKVFKYINKYNIQVSDKSYKILNEIGLVVEQETEIEKIKF
ncbi:MAG: hypothetical protein LH629_15895, partial [Ignavibacteria bacterium]|nr:hypothetical protein [Ignavibacteria bacterium]